MEFSPQNKIVKLCIKGMALEESGNTEAAGRDFLLAWKEASNDFEKFLAAFFVARHHTDRLEWLQVSLEHALRENTEAIKSAFPTLYRDIAKCYEEAGDTVKANEHYKRAASFEGVPSDPGPFFHGTKADLSVGDLLTAGGNSNYKPGLVMNHIYFTASITGAGLAAALAQGDGKERVYVVEPTGSFEHDPNVTDKKFPGNLTRSYRSREPLRIVGEITDWSKLTEEDVTHWKERLAKNKGDIIN